MTSSAADHTMDCYHRLPGGAPLNQARAVLRRTTHRLFTGADPQATGRHSNRRAMNSCLSC